MFGAGFRGHNPYTQFFCSTHELIFLKNVAISKINRLSNYIIFIAKMHCYQYCEKEMIDHKQISSYFALVGSVHSGPWCKFHLLMNLMTHFIHKYKEEANRTNEKHKEGAKCWKNKEGGTGEVEQWHKQQISLLFYSVLKKKFSGINISIYMPAQIPIIHLIKLHLHSSNFIHTTLGLTISALWLLTFPLCKVSLSGS